MNNLKYISRFMAIAVLMTAFAMFTSCNDDDDETNEYNTPIVHLQGGYFLGEVKSFKINHRATEGLVGEVNLSVVAKVQLASKEDIVINLAIVTEDEEIADKFVFSSNKIVLKAGEMQSKEIQISMPDITFMEEVEDPLKYSFNITITGIEAAPNVKISQVYNSIQASIEKSAFALDYLVKAIPANSKLMARTDWGITLIDGVEGITANLIDGSTSSDVAIDNSNIWVVIDFGKEKNITGIRTNHWSANYSPSEIIVYTSKDGKIWRSLGSLNTGKTATQNIGFQIPVATQYLKYDMLQYPARVDITEFNVYEPI